jgi:kynureninase
MSVSSAPSATADLSDFRNEFVIPTNKEIGANRVAQENGMIFQTFLVCDLISRLGLTEDEPCVYLCGNSLGLLPKQSASLVKEELHVWGSR